MGPLDPDIVGAILGIPGTVLALALILRFKLKKKELEMRGSNAGLGPMVDALRDDFDQLADTQEHTRARLAEMQEHTQTQLAEMQERLDFAERLLTAGRASQGEKGK